MLCNDSRLLEDGQLAGDPTETALVDMAFNQIMNNLYIEKIQELKKFHLIQKEN